MKRQIVLLIFGLCFASSAAAADFERVAPEEVGISSDRLNRLGDYMNRLVDNGEIAGIQILIARHGKVAFFENIGLARADFIRKELVRRGIDEDRIDRVPGIADLRDDRPEIGHFVVGAAAIWTGY